MGREKDQILLQMKSMKFENESLQRLGRERDLEMESWKSNYIRDKRY
jgi:hypothetical protein